jgi:N-dimethylarginine dimethylaminohydrolase
MNKTNRSHHVLMCEPRHFAVTYSINPWMDPGLWSEGSGQLPAQAARQWQALHDALIAHGAIVTRVPPTENLPDLVFTANAAVVLDRKALLARFRHAERQGEEPVFAAAFDKLRQSGLIDEVRAMPEGVALEGAGDCIFDPARGLFWMGTGFRSEAAAAPVVEDTFGVPCISLTLADPRFYHLDTAFCALPCGSVMYFPGAFTAAARAQIESRVLPAQRIALSEADAVHFAANAVCLGRVVVLSRASAELRRALSARGYAVVETPLDVFQRSGGSACCLTLRLDHARAAAQASVEQAAGA